MTSEERWVRIENALQTVAERQALHEEHGRQTDQRISVLAENMIALVHKVDDLSDTVRNHEGKIDALSEIVQSHEGKIDALIDTVGRIVGREEKN